MANRAHAGAIVVFLLAFVAWVTPQSQATDGQIEGIVTDFAGAAIPNVTVAAVNTDTGIGRSARSNESGIFRLPILPLGTYTLAVEHAGFKKFVQSGITLSAGQTRSISISLEPGGLDETVTVTSDAAIADVSKFDVGRHLNSRDIKNLPLISRNPNNFVLLQPGTTGRSVLTPAVIRASSNGLLRRVGYQLDGSYINDTDVGGFRLIFVSEVYIKEMQLLSSGYSAEFGDTAGTYVNFVTPSGTNRLDGSITYQWRPRGLSARPFDSQGSGGNPNVNAHSLIGSVGGPIVKDRWHFYTGYESAWQSVPQLITITPGNRTALINAGVPPEILQDPTASDRLPYFIVRSDVELSEKTRIALRYNRMDNDLRNALSFGTAGINTTERSFDFLGWDQAVAGQVVTSFSETFFNEFRFQRAERVVGSYANASTGSGPTINITGSANLGPPTSIGSFGTNQSTIDLRDAVTRVFDRHSLKFGGGVNFIHGQERLSKFSQYNFASVADYERAVSGVDRRSYSQYIEAFGDPDRALSVVFANLFVQDDWNVTRRLKVAAGLRYELYSPPKGDPNAPLPFSRKFKTDANNFGPRLGIAYLARDGRYRTVIRGGFSVHYDPFFIRFYRRALQNNGDPRFFTFSFRPNDEGAPEFPGDLGSLPAGTVIGPRDIDAVSPDFRTMYAVHTNFQIEQALGEDLSLTFGYLHSFARNIPVYRNINYLPSGAQLADGRPIYDPDRRNYPEFDLVMTAGSDGRLAYRGAFVQVHRRYSGGVQMMGSYTFSRARDDAPEDVPGGLSASDPSDLSRDKGFSAGDVRHTFRMSLVADPRFRTSSRIAGALLNGYRMGLILFADSGEVQNIVTNLDLNRDGVFGGNGPDRPVGVPRNSLRLPAFFSADMRLSRSFKLRESMSLDIYGEATNVFNGKFISSYASTTLNASRVDPATGLLRGPLPDFRNGPVAWRASRQAQVGLRVNF